MNIWLPLAIAFATVSTPKPFPVRFAHGLTGREVTVCIDGALVETTFAGKMGFRDSAGTWESVCAGVRNPVAEGQMFLVRPLATAKIGGNIAKAGSIIGTFFKAARTPSECAGLQIAVW